MASLPLRRLWLLCFLCACAEAQIIRPPELSQIYYDFTTSADIYPPLDPAAVWGANSTIEPIQASFVSIFTSIDVISPATSEFTVTSRNVLYWTKDSCNQTETQRVACADTIGNTQLHFLQPRRAAGTDVAYFLHRDEIFAEDLALVGLQNFVPAADMTESQVTYQQQFDMRTYPYEYHILKIQLESVYSSKVVNFTAFPIDVGLLNPSVPPGWTLRDIECSFAFNRDGRAISEVSTSAGGPLVFPIYTCNILVSRQNVGWWISSFLLVFGLNLISYIGGVGVASHLTAEARDDKDGARGGLFDGMRVIGLFSIGLLLTYVFQVQDSPYDQPVDFWPSIAASTWIYFLGLVGILLAATLHIVSALLLKKALLADGFIGGISKTYNLKVVPLEGVAPDEELPLLDLDIEKKMAAKAKSASKVKSVLPKGPDAQRDSQTDSLGSQVDSGVPTGPDSQQDSQPESPSSQEETGVPKSSDSQKESSPENPPQSESTDDPPREPLPSSRKSNQKIYTVLSIQDAAMVNKYVFADFVANTLLIIGVAVAAVVILVQAHSDYQDAIS